MEQNTIKINNFNVSNKLPFFLIAGPCAIESKDGLIEITPRNKDRRNATVCQLRHNIAQVLLALYLSGRDVRRQGKATPG